jgi:hypothetical protein
MADFRTSNSGSATFLVAVLAVFFTALDVDFVTFLVRFVFVAGMYRDNE